MKQISVRTSVLTVMLTLVGIVASLLLLSQFYFSEKLAKESTNEKFELISKNVAGHLKEGAVNTKNILTALRKHSDFQEQITFDPNHSTLDSLVQVLQIKTNIYAIYFTQENGAFYEVVNMQSSPQLHQIYSAPKQTAWTVITIIENEQQLAFFNDKLELIDKRNISKKYNPHSRPWYIEASASNEVIKTAPYLFSNLDLAGITYAAKLDNNSGVLAIDYMLGQLNEVLASQKIDVNSEVFLVNDRGEKLVSSDFASQTFSKQNANPIMNQLLDFTPEENAYIQSSSTLLISNENDWEPFDFVARGEPRGYSIDLLKLLSLKSGLNFQFVNGFQWSDLVSMFKKQELDILHSLYKTDEREKIGLFSEPLFSFKNYFILPEDSEGVKDINDLLGKTIVVIKGWVAHKFLQEKYPNISLLVVDDVEDAYIALSKGNADAMIDSKESFLYITKKLYLNNIKLSSWSKEFDNNQTNSIYMMVQNNNPLLLSILNKTLRSLTPIELGNIENKWFAKSDNEMQLDYIDAELLKVILDKKTNQIIDYSTEKNHYFAMIMPTDRQDTYLGIKIDADILLKPYLDNIEQSFYIAFLLLLISIPIIIFSTDLIIKPIKALVLENKKIEKRQYKDVGKISTYITEFDDLSTSLVDMSDSIQAYEKKQEDLLDAIIKIIAEAIDEKSPYTGGHCERVPEIAQLLLDEASRCKDDIFKGFTLTSKDALREFEIGAWLHDCGKVTTPEYVVDKATKLETIYNRIHEIRMRFEVLWRDAEIAYLNDQISKDDLLNRHEVLQSDYEFIAKTNIGGEFMDEDKKKRVEEIACQEWLRHFDDSIGLGGQEELRYKENVAGELPIIERLLSDKPEHIVKRDNFNHDAYEQGGFKLVVPEHLYNYGEIHNLTIERGTLTPEERYKINEHVILTIKMLENIPFPENLKNIPEYAGTHHETLIGTGYPRKLTKDELSIPARIMAIADIFEALTASDRPYKKSKTLSESIKIMSFMVKDQHIDEDLFKLFLDSGVYKTYAEKYLMPSQIDDVDIDIYLG